MSTIIRLLILLLLTSPAWAEETSSFEEVMDEWAKEAANIEKVMGEAKETYNLEGLMDEGEEHRAPQALYAQMAQNPALQEDLKACHEYFLAGQLEGSIKNFEYLFSATPVTLSSTGHPAHVVVPTVYCPEFVGAHAIWYWIMEQQPDGTYRNLLSGATDAVLVMDTQTLGYHDLATVYGMQTLSLFRFDGTKYQYISDPKTTETETPESPDPPPAATSTPLLPD